MYEIVICDDTESDLLQLKMAVEKSKHYDMSSMNIHTFNSGMSFLEDMKSNTDLILIDMQMKMMNGFETIMELRKKNQTAVVCFCSAVVTPQTEHFEVSPYRYILKNESKERIAKTIDDLLVEMKRRKQQKTLYRKSKAWLYYRPVCKFSNKTGRREDYIKGKACSS